MKLYELPIDMQEEVKKLASQHSVNIETALEYYMMGGREHADYLCSLADMDVPDLIVKLKNYLIWEKKNIQWRKELESL